MLAVYLNHTKNPEVQIRMKGFRPDGKVIGQIYEIGVPSIIMSAIGSVMNYGMNLILISFTSTATAVFGVYFKLQSFIFMPVFGLNNGVIPIIAYNYGAKKKDRVVSAIRRNIIYAIVIMAFGCLIFQLMPDRLLGLFEASDTMLQIGIPALRIISLCFVFAGFAIGCNSTFQALGKSVYSMTISVARQLLILLPAAYILAQFGDVNLVWWAFPIAEVVSVLGATGFMIHVNRTIISKIEPVK
jgi:Na+-driven multidrug efflux pump